MKPGDRVVIIEDVRENGVPPGTIGTYDGELPFTVALTNDGGDTFFMEYDYESFVGHEIFLTHYPLWEGGEKPGDNFAMVMRNPRITLPDGSKIWGAECWWKAYVEGKPVDLQKEKEWVEDFKEFSRAVIKLKEEYDDKM